jgi:5-methyltetrahydrofolate--homocysteine methyltransferase
MRIPMDANRPPDGSTQRERAEALQEVLAERILVLDGATGTWIQSQDLTAEDFGGPELEGCNENLVLTRPDLILRMHEEYLDAGADMVETDTFGGTPLVLAEYGLASQTVEINRRAAELAREAAAKFSLAGQTRFVAGSMGPTTKAMTVTGGVTFEDMIVHYRMQALGLLSGGADVLLLETTQDTRNLKAGLIGVEQAFAEIGWRVPIMVSATIEPMGTMLAGQAVDALYASVMHAPLLSVGINCATGPEFMTDHIRSLSALAKTLTSCYPNAGLPDSDGKYSETPESISRELTRFMREGWVNIVGGCCGTTPAHIRALTAAAQGQKPRRVPIHNKTLVSGVEALEVDVDNRPVLVGERTNVLGSRKFKRLIAEGKFETAAEIGRAQVKNGAQIIDVCLQDPDRDEVADVNAFLERVTKMVKVPLMLDSTDAKVLELGLKWSLGKSILNSINLEDGEERFRAVLPLAQRYGAALVVGTIDEDPEHGMAVTRERKLEVARRSYTLLTEKYGFPAEDILFDPLVFPCGTGDAKYVGSAVETIEGIRLIKAEFPESKTILGISNVSFGLPESGREVLNSVFLYHCVKAGLDMAIVNSEKVMRYPSIPDDEKRLAEDLLYNRGEDPVAAFAGHFKAKGAAPKVPKERAGTPLERLPSYILEGSKEGLVEDLEAVRLGGMVPLDVINGPLMDGMREVGRLFNANELIVAEVLQSAEAMKAAVSHLEKFMEKSGGSRKGKVLLATVKGDVHDIGKNLVEIILSNNGYEVINLGIKVPPEKLIAAHVEHTPDLIGLSGLLVKSAQQMVTTAQDLTAAGVTVPMLVGGAALSQKFADHRIAPAYGGLTAYAEDAMRGLALADRILSGSAEREALVAESDRRRQATATATRVEEEIPLSAPAVRSTEVSVVDPLPAPDLEEHVLPALDLSEVWRCLNPHMLYAKHLGLRGSFRKLKEAGDPKLAELERVIERVQSSGWIAARAMYRFFPADSEGNTLHLQLPGGGEACFTFPRQVAGERLCLSDFVHPRAGGAPRDSVALFITTAGEGIRARAEELKASGEYLLCHALQALAVETAEAAAEWLHGRMREAWGFPDPPEMTMVDRFQGRYRGKRYSFGYPACPELADQATLFHILDGRKIGVELTEGFMMDPEASVSAVVLHHPQARYFSV